MKSVNPVLEVLEKKGVVFTESSVEVMRIRAPPSATLKAIRPIVDRVVIDLIQQLRESGRSGRGRARGPGKLMR